MREADLEKARKAALEEAHDFYFWLGGLNLSDDDQEEFLLECVGGCLLVQYEMAARMKAALESGDPAKIQEVAQQWIDVEMLGKFPREEGRKRRARDFPDREGKTV